MSNFKETIDPKAKLTIASMDGGLEVEAVYNPKEVQLDKSVPWSKHKDSKSDNPHLEFTGAEPMAMSFELMFDGFEKNQSVQPTIDKLLDMARIIEDKKRPHQVKVLWGGSGGGKLPEFVGVIESVSTKYQMFSVDGLPLRATCNVKLKQASQLSFKKK